MPKFYDFGNDYEPVLKTIQRMSVSDAAQVVVPFEPIRDQRGNCFTDAHIDGCVFAQFNSFWVHLTNRNQASVRILWPEARYVDELGGAHTIYHYVRDPPENVLVPGPVESLESGEHRREVIAPGYKTHNVEGDKGDLHVFREPLLPTTLKQRTPEQMKAYVDDLAKHERPVKLLLPVEINGARYNYTFSFVLNPR